MISLHRHNTEREKLLRCAALARIGLAVSVQTLPYLIAQNREGTC